MSPTGYVTDGGFPIQMEAISGLFSSTELLIPCGELGSLDGTTAISGNSMRVNPLEVPSGSGVWRKFGMFRWLFRNGPIIWRSVRRADAVHTPIPGDVGTIGMIMALILKKRLFVRHCGNWSEPRTIAEKIWKWSMERFAGSRNVMMATGGGLEQPSPKFPRVKWIFSTSLPKETIRRERRRELPPDGKLKLIVACRQEPRKGTEALIDSMPLILKAFPGATLDIVGDGSLLNMLIDQATRLNISEHIKFHGKVAQSKVMELLQDADLFCYPTMASEGFPKVVLEALASGLPVITTKVSVLPFLLANDCGVLIDEPSATAISEAVREACHSQERYSHLSANALLTAQEYSLERWQKKIGGALCDAWNIRIDELGLRNLKGYREQL